MIYITVKTTRGMLYIRIVDSYYGVARVVSGQDFPDKFTELAYLGACDSPDATPVYRYPKPGEYVCVHTFLRGKKMISGRVISCQEPKPREPRGN